VTATVLVAGPRWAGVSSLVAVLRERMPEVAIAETCEQPAAVVVAVSAAAPMTDSDRDLIHRACGAADLVIGAVSKIDAHRRWREVLAADRALLAERADRYRAVPWIGVAAAPELGAPNVDELVAVLTDGLAEPDLDRRNELRCRDNRMQQLREQRGDIVRGRRSATPMVRARLHEARVRLVFGIRARCVQIASELRESVDDVPRGGAAEFEALVRAAAEALIDEVDADIDRELGVVAVELSLSAPAGAAPRPPEISGPRWRTDRLQRRLTAVLGAGFGVGVALAASRLAGALHGPEIVGLAAGAALGLLAAIWVVRARSLLQYRAALDRWLGEVVAALRARGEELVTSRMLATETAFADRLTERDEALVDRVRAIDAELRRMSRLTSGSERGSESVL
jgi:hypothetical protein